MLHCGTRHPTRLSSCQAVRIVNSQCIDYAKDGGFFDQLAASGKKVDAGLEERLANGASLAKDAYRRLAEGLESELLAQAPEQDGGGS